MDKRKVTIPSVEVLFFGEYGNDYSCQARKNLWEACILDPEIIVVYDYTIESMEAKSHKITNAPTFIYGIEGIPETRTKVHGNLSPEYIYILFKGLRKSYEKHNN